MDITTLQFTLSEMVAVLGLTQSLLLLIYMMARAGRLEHAGIPSLYFLVLSLAFVADFGERFFINDIAGYDLLLPTAWFATIPFSLLVIRQVALIHDLPAWYHWLWLLAIPLLPILAVTVGQNVNTAPAVWAQLFAVVFGCLGLLSLWDTRGLFNELYNHKLSGRERYWLCLSLIFLNSGLLLFLAGGLADEKLARGVLGLGLIYIVSTCLFRIYPQAVRLRSEAVEGSLSDADRQVTAKIEHLLTMDKVYQEAAYGRTDMARELGIPEAQLSRIINLHFGKTLPQILNECRVADAAKLLAETDASVKQISQDVGFNSMATFNRVFKEHTGKNPSDFRTLSRIVTASGQGDRAIPYVS